MTHQTMEMQIPFAGFYYSIHSDEVDQCVERLADYCDYDIPQSLMNLFWDAADYDNAYQDYAKEYAESFCAEYLDDGEFAAMESPREYNFATDRIFVKVPRSTVAKLWRKTDKATLDRIVKERFTSYDGFISHYRNDWREWGGLSEWDHNQLGTLLLAYLETERGEEWDHWAEHSLMESYLCNGGPDNALWKGDKAKRAWRIFDYLHERSQRPVKTMAQWRLAFMKPWETTPLGQKGTIK